MQEHAAAIETSTTQQLNALGKELTRCVGAFVEESQTSLLAKENEKLAMLKTEIQSLQQSGDAHEGTVLYKELSALHVKVENARLESQQAIKAVFDIVNEELAKVIQETASTMNFVLVKLTEQSSEQKAMVEAIRKMVAELKLMRGKLDTMQTGKHKMNRNMLRCMLTTLTIKVKMKKQRDSRKVSWKQRLQCPHLLLDKQFPRQNKRFLLQ